MNYSELVESNPIIAFIPEQVLNKILTEAHVYFSKYGSDMVMITDYQDPDYLELTKKYKEVYTLEHYKYGKLCSEELTEKQLRDLGLPTKEGTFERKNDTYVLVQPAPLELEKHMIRLCTKMNGVVYYINES